MADGPEVSFQDKLLGERTELVNFSAMRLWGPLAWLALVVAMRLLYATPAWRELLPVALGYAAYSVGLTIVRRASPRRSLPYATALVDVPAAGIIGLVWAHAAPQ